MPLDASSPSVAVAGCDQTEDLLVSRLVEVLRQECHHRSIDAKFFTVLAADLLPPFTDEKPHHRWNVLIQSADNLITPPPSRQNYHFRALVFSAPSVEEQLQSLANDILNGTILRRREFVSTRSGAADTRSFLSAVREGLAKDGGLYVPVEVPKLPSGLLNFITSSRRLDYAQTAQLILERLVDPIELSPAELQGFLAKAYAKERWSSPDICPVHHLKMPSTVEGAAPAPGSDQVYVMELYHGPTAAFKDFALQLFPFLFNKSVEKEKNKYLILGATSGDTGVAAIEGVRLSGLPGLRTMILYPLSGVSRVQKMQMISANGPNVRVFGVRSDFDFCQSTVKYAFNDMATVQKLDSEQHYSLASANSINWGRLLPQIVYYFFGYAELVRKHNLPIGSEIDISVPTGNFGNILSAYFAKLMGLPIRSFIMASNENDVLFDFLRTGVYDIKTRTLIPTTSPSIDILRASNIERLLFVLSDGDSAFVHQMMKDLADPHKLRFEVTDSVKSKLKSIFWSMRCDAAARTSTMTRVFDASGKTYVVEPHTAVAVFAVEEYLAELAKNKGPVVPILTASTAHWAKFPRALMDALHIQAPAESLHGFVSSLDPAAQTAPFVLREEAIRVQRWYDSITAAFAKPVGSAPPTPDNCSQPAAPLKEVLKKIESNSEAVNSLESSPDMKQLVDQVILFCTESNQ
jgi:threonine synthase